MVNKKERMIKTSIDLPESQYRFLVSKALDQRLKGGTASFVSIIRGLITELIETDSVKPKRSKK